MSWQTIGRKRKAFVISVRLIEIHATKRLFPRRGCLNQPRVAAQSLLWDSHIATFPFPEGDR